MRFTVLRCLGPAWRLSEPVSACLGALLVGAALLKGHELATRAILESSVFFSRWFLAALVCAEFIVGLWLLSGIAPGLSRFTALLLFAAFAVFSLWLGLSGAKSCGCFGRLSVSPWWTFLMDVAAVLALGIVLTRGESQHTPTRVGLSGIVSLGLILTLLVPLSVWVMLTGGKHPIRHIPSQKVSTTRTLAGAPGPLGLGSMFPDYGLSLRERRSKSLACGPEALLASMRALGCPISDQQRQEILSSAGEAGTTLRQLNALALRYGLQTTPVSITPAELHATGLPAIVHLEGRSFAALVGYHDDGFLLNTSEFEERSLSAPEFTRRFGNRGQALLLSRSGHELENLIVTPRESAVTSAPDLRLSTSMLGIGRIFSRHWRGSIGVQNIGGSPLAIESCESSCGTLDIRIEQTTLAPGARTLIHVAGIQAEPGLFHREIVLTSNSGAIPRTRVPITGVLEYPVIALQPAVLFCNLRRGEQATQELELLVDGTSLSDVQVDLPTECPAVVTVAERSGKPALLLSWQGLATSGWHDYRLSIRARSISDSLASSVLLTAHILPDVEVAPAALTLPRDCDALTRVPPMLHVRRLGRGNLPELEFSWDNDLLNRYGSISVKRTTAETSESVVYFRPECRSDQLPTTPCALRVMDRATNEVSARVSVLFLEGGEVN